MALNLLHANDAPGQYPSSWYRATATPLDPFPALAGDTRADVCIIGAGYTGLSAALHLVERGYSVVLLEAQRVALVPLAAMAVSLDPGSGRIRKS